MSEEEYSSLISRLESGDDSVRDILIERNLRFVQYISNKFKGFKVEPDELFSVGTLGLIKAVKSFDPSKKVKLSTYATVCIRNEILIYFRSLKKISFEVSLDAPLYTDIDGNELSLADVLGTESDLVYTVVQDGLNREQFYQALQKLKPQHRRIIDLRLAGKKQNEIAEIMGKSQSYISRLERFAVNNLEKYLKFRSKE